MKNYQKVVMLSLLYFLIGLNSCKKDSPLYKHDEKEDFQRVAQFFSASNAETQQRLIQTYQEKGIEEFLLADFLKTKSVSSRDITNFEELNTLVLENPMLTIAYPSFAFHDETFEQHLSLIDYTVMLLDDPDEVETLPAFNSSGQLINISSTFDESLRYCVVKYNEAYTAVDPATQKTYFDDNVSVKLFDFEPKNTVGKYVFYSVADIINAKLIEEGRYGGTAGPVDPDGGDPDDPDESCELPCERDCYKEKDELHSVKWSSKDCVKNFESGFHLPQVEMIAYYGIPRYNSGSVSVDLIAKDVFIHWKDMTTKFSDPLGLEIATWTEDLGNRWQVLWIERDYWNKVQDKFTLGFSVSFKIKDPTSSVETTVGANAAWEVVSMKQDKEIGRSLIEYCDNAKDEGETYKPCACGGSGGFWFKEHIRD